ncbi:MAG: DNA primase [Pseudomonadota bacterium]|nr:DNA primase [Pseudomonadota bacterium]
MAGRIPEHFIDDLLTRIDIVDLIESHLPLRKAGRDFQALCPFHDEKTPSFTISREKQFYHCFGCSAHGSAIGFLMNYRNLEFIEAVEELAQIAGLEVPREAGRERAVPTREVFELLEQACGYYETQLRNHADRSRIVDYLKARDISGQIAKKFRLGFAPAGWNNLLAAMSTDGAGEEQLERAGLVIRREHGGYYDRFRERIIFPIRDRRGRVIGFGGRVIDVGEPKYLNSPETEVFHKGRELYGLHEALDARGTLTELIVVEGYMDVIAMHQFGMSNVVATLGTAVTSDHLDQLFRHVPEVIFCFDGDAAGERAAWKALEISLPLMEGNRQVRFVFLPDGHDPDTAVRAHGVDGLFRVSRNFGLSEYLLDKLKAEVDLASGEGRARLVARAKPYLLKIPGEGHRGAGIQLLHQLTLIDERMIRQDLFKGMRRFDNTPPRSGLVKFTTRTLEERVLALLLQRPSLARLLDADTAEFLERELDDSTLLLQTWRTVETVSTATTAGILERWRGREHEGQLAALAALDLNLSDEAMETELKGALARLTEKAEDRRFRRLTAIPLNDLTDEQKEIVRNYHRGGPGRPTS